MKLAARINAFKNQNSDLDLLTVLKEYKEINGLTHLELNFPEHFTDDVNKLKEHIGEFKVNGLATRFSKKFLNGEFTNPNISIRQEAIKVCKDAIDLVVELGGEVLTIWQAYDGFDYSFQTNYIHSWDLMIDAFREICDYNPKVKISIEYKPYEPRGFAFADSIGNTLMIIDEVNRDNLGVTIDFCHALMKHEHPSLSLALALRKGKLFGVHLNDGNNSFDDGYLVGSYHFLSTIEFFYYLKKYNYDGVIYFDTFAKRVPIKEEIQTNIKLVQMFDTLVDKLGVDSLDELISKNNELSSFEIYSKIFNLEKEGKYD